MAGSPVKRARLEQLDEQEDEIFAKLEDGRSLIEIAAQAGCSRPFLSKWLERNPERSGRYKQARAQAAHALADDVQHVTDNVLQRAVEGKASKVEIAAAKLSTDAKKWKAGIWNSQYKENGNAQVNVTMDMGSMFLAAMRKPAPPITGVNTVIDLTAPQTPIDAIPPALTASGEQSQHVITPVVTVPEFDVLEPAKIPRDDDFLREPVQRRSLTLLDDED